VLDNLADTTAGRLVLTGCAFLAAWLLSRLAGRLTRRFLVRQEKRRARFLDDTAELPLINRRLTLVAIIRTTVSAVLFLAAMVYAASLFFGSFDRFTAVAGLGLTIAVVGYIGTRIIGDMLAGAVMFVENWFAVGDTIVIEPHHLQGVVENVNLRATTIRTVTGERVHVHNSHIQAVRVFPRGIKELAIEMFVDDQERGVELLEYAGGLLPLGATAIVREMKIDEIEQLSSNLVRIRARVAVAPGREWLVEEWLTTLLRERADEEGPKIAHGPVVFALDREASRRFAPTTLRQQDGWPSPATTLR
jgi:small-conductance mechanosensitive channel